MSEAATNITHMIWAGRWIPAKRCEVEGQPAWEFTNGKDACDWLAYPPDPEEDSAGSAPIGRPLA